MQTTSKELYNKVALVMKKDFKLVKSVGDAVFIATSNYFKYPPTLIGKLKGVGSWYMRKKKLDEFIINNTKRFLEEDASDLTDKTAKEYIRLRSQYEILIERQKDYILFKEKKERIKEIRHKTQPLQKPKDEDEC